ncbi:MAG: DUF2029 domain-containing protein [Candidatus Omnitrophica bacterium]|nr:DUF2029 domain-containing protein [Candidatus Omnitrophota bacterium]
MEKNKQSDFLRTFFCFGMTVYLMCFLFMIHFYRVSKETFREDFGRNFTWPDIGLDFHYLYNISSSVRDGGTSMSVHPPWAAVSYIPLTFLGPKSAYVLFTYALIALLFSAIFLCIRENKVFLTGQMDLFIALLCTGIFYHTYPVLFALERGQFEILLGFFSTVGLFALSRNFRKTAVIALVLAAQYKIYPVILGSVLFIRYRWKTLAVFMALNVLMLFIRGKDVGFSYIKVVKEMVEHPCSWPGNHCLISFAHEMVRLRYLSPDLEVITAKALSAAAVLVFTAAFLWLAFKGKPHTSSAFSVAEAGLIGMAFQLMSLLPATSHDYKLPIQIIPFLLMISRGKADFTIPKPLVYVLMAALSASMAFMFVPFFLIKTFGVIASFMIYAVFAFSPIVKEPKTLTT